MVEMQIGPFFKVNAWMYTVLDHSLIPMVTYSFWKLFSCLSSLSILFQSVQKLITANTVVARQPRTTFVCIVMAKWPNWSTTAPTRQSPATKLNVKVSHWIINGNWLSVTKYKSQCNEAYVAIMYVFLGI